MADYQDRMRERIVQAREEKGYSPEELALRAGVSAKQIRRIESGESRNPHLSTVRAIAEATGKEVTWIRPDLEAEEAELQRQLDRIERMLRLLLAEAGVDPGEELERALDPDDPATGQQNDGTAEAAPAPRGKARRSAAPPR